LRWLGIVVLLFGLWTGVIYAVAPLVAPGHGNATFSAIEVILISLCAWGLLRLQPRRR
jgi:hypothetical protein